MIVASEGVLREIEGQLGMAVRQLTDNVGNPVHLPTVEAPTLRIAALVALQMVAGETVWDGTVPLRLTKPRQPVGVVPVIHD